MSTDVTTPADVNSSRADRERAVAEAIALLHSWSEGDEDDAREQRETFAAITKGIDEARAPYRTLFDGDRP